MAEYKIGTYQILQSNEDVFVAEVRYEDIGREQDALFEIWKSLQNEDGRSKTLSEGVEMLKDLLK